MNNKSWIGLMNLTLVGANLFFWFLTGSVFNAAVAVLLLLVLVFTPGPS